MCHSHTYLVPFRFRLQRAVAAFRAILERCAFVIAFRRAIPPSLPSSAAWTFLFFAFMSSTIACIAACINLLLAFPSLSYCSRVASFSHSLRIAQNSTSFRCMCAHSRSPNLRPARSSRALRAFRSRSPPQLRGVTLPEGGCGAGLWSSDFMRIRKQGSVHGLHGIHGFVPTCLSSLPFLLPVLLTEVETNP
jgi:hypothetical protein